ncbi:Cell division trigger factor [Caldibacillus thermoamylovorans]|jgi:trigger factor|uniref:Trigger factor n=1 Tax=Caldibacillus thermoamylovorans TaxID=35841 RepID=A0A0D0EQH5_9BACI|nr:MULTISPECIES: trigger factor [Bacillaceae]KIO61035.1 Cell division trigger factor [Caldibacillus thermoamylovorans]KIO62153.1 Cell division trigger factor [Caldibacillus thermoamylovorans]KIO68877.1 Cell division trigger factor [Caldibacillus thermoamylovorans]KIO70128.1 Cell division trigger factor [Caldibacillus thermoamylovorans]MBU5342623.1 trigger factor [Caldifermentibacillus hisashii]
MSAKWEKLEGNQGKLTVEVDAETFNKALDQAFKKVQKQLNVPGFRKGRVPRQIFEQRFGVESLYQDALDIVLPDAYSNAIDETGIEPVDQPEIDIEQIGKGQSLIFTADVTVKPEVKLGEYKGLEVPKVNTEVTDEDVEAELKELQKRHAELVVKEDEPAEQGDTVVIDFEGFVDGEAFEGGKAENHSLEIGSDSFIPGFEEQLVGVKAGDEKEVQVTFPEEYHAEELAGKPAVFKVKVHEVKQLVLPELDDDFAVDVDDEVETLDALKEKIENRLKDEKEHTAKHEVENAVIEKAAENAEIDIPEVMIDNEVERMVKEFDQRLQQQGLNLELYSQFSGQDIDSLKETMREDAEKRVRVNLTLEAIVKAENIDVTEEEVEKELQNMAEMYNMPVEQIQQILGSTAGIKEELKFNKAVQLLVDNSKTVEE